MALGRKSSRYSHMLPQSVRPQSFLIEFQAYIYLLTLCASCHDINTCNMMSRTTHKSHNRCPSLNVGRPLPALHSVAWLPFGDRQAGESGKQSITNLWPDRSV